ncbi:MAG: 4Fe-4S dicluster domain-containing protein, partial [Proteobacteria bacterium]|nr:4Fe-4S dicluster domain-containing protein [Pseudomonadota bacterium]
ACMQCGTCSASCPNAAFMDMTPRKLWRLAQLGMLDEIERSEAFWLCSSCYTCTLRCPRGLPLTQVMAEIKRVVAVHGGRTGRRHGNFYRLFLNNVEKYGRVQESTLMTCYLAAMGSPSLALSFAPVGLKLAAKGKMHPPHSAMKGTLKPLFAKVREMEARS